MNLMPETMSDVYQQQAARAFDQQAALFDELYANNALIQYKRDRVRKHAGALMAPGSMILELNAGTGEDALYFARQGHRVHATDISSGMLAVLNRKVQAMGYAGQVTQESCAFNRLDQLNQKGPYDMIFSNFAGLNCCADLRETLDSCQRLLKSGGLLTMVIMPAFCLWETLLFFRGRCRTALRRWGSRGGVSAHIEGQYFRCWYHRPQDIIRHLEGSFDLLALEGLCSIVPPSYLEHFDQKYPRLYRFLQQQEWRYKSSWPWKLIGDYYIISFRKRR